MHHGASTYHSSYNLVLKFLNNLSVRFDDRSSITGQLGMSSITFYRQLITEIFGQTSIVADVVTNLSCSLSLSPSLSEPLCLDAFQNFRSINSWQVLIVTIAYVYIYTLSSHSFVSLEFAGNSLMRLQKHRTETKRNTREQLYVCIERTSKIFFFRSHYYRLLCTFVSFDLFYSAIYNTIIFVQVKLRDSSHKVKRRLCNPLHGWIITRWLGDRELYKSVDF